MRGRRARHEQNIVLDYNNYIAFEVTGKWNYKNQCAAYDGSITVWKSSLDSKLSAVWRIHGMLTDWIQSVRRGAAR